LTEVWIVVLLGGRRFAEVWYAPDANPLSAQVLRWAGAEVVTELVDYQRVVGAVDVTQPNAGRQP